MKSGSITFKLLAVVIGASLLIAVIGFLLANSKLTRIIDENQNSMYEERLEVIWNTLARSDERLHKTGWVETYAEDFKKTAVQSLRESYYNDPGQPIYPWILDAEGRVVLHPILPEGDGSLKNHEGMMRLMQGIDQGNFNSKYNGQNKWYIYRRFDAWDWIIGYAVPLDVKYADARSFNTSLLMVMSGVSLLILIISSWIVARFTKPIVTLTHLSSQIADGNLDQQIDLGSKDEVGTLARSFDNMRHAIKKQIGNLNHEIEVRKQAESRLQRNEDNLRITLNSIGDAVIATDTDGIIVRMNPVAEKLSGWPFSEAKGKNLTDVLNLVHASTREPINSVVANVLARTELTGLSNNSILIARDGSEAHIADSGAPIRSEMGQLLGMVFVFRDVTMELALQERLNQSHKMDAIGQLAGGVAHDFNNMLTGILGAARLLKDFEPDDPETPKFYSIIKDSASRAADLTQKLLTFARKQPSTLVVIDIHRIIKDAVALFERTVDRRIQVITTLNANSVWIEGDPALLQNAFLNLGINAAHAMPDGGTLHIESTNVQMDDAACQASLFEIEPGPYLEVEVYDTGSGIPTSDLPHIFEPFFTTKQVGKGTGLGLASVFGTIQQHHGAISCHNRPEGGASFRLLLPLTNETATLSSVSSIVEEPGTGTILVVDDEEALRTTAQAMLQQLGYSVLLAENGRQALEIFSDNPMGIDLVLLDMIMPRMNGRDCLEAMQKMNPNVKAILVSGFAEETDVETMKAAGLLDFIAKPYSSDELSQKIHTALS